MGLFDQFSALFKRDSESLSDLPQSVTQDRRRRPRINAQIGTYALIIDDSNTVVMAIKKYLRSVGFETFEAFDAETGLSMIQENTPDIIFLDIMLPGMNGFTALRTIRRDPLSRDIPVIMMSGNEQAVEQFYVSRIGADGFMKKPFTREDLFLQIEQLLDDKFIPRRAQSAPGTLSPDAAASAF